MKWTKALVVIAMLQYAAFGVLALSDPARVSGIAHLRVIDATSLNEIRAMFGGVQLALAVFLACCLANRWPLRAGLFLVTSIFVAVVVARTASVLLEGTPSADYVGIAVFEAAFAAVCLVTLARERG